MKLRTLTLRHFRNVERSTLLSDAHLNFLIGANGQGKTSFLEALSFLATLRSFRGGKTPDVIRYGEPLAEIVAEIGEDDWKTELKILFSREDGSKTALINGKTYKSSTQYLSQRFGHVELGFHAVVFNPSDHDLVRGEPAIRRAYLDRVIAAEDLDYLKNLSKYQKVVQQRNALLRSEERPSAALLAGFSEPLAHLGAWIVDRRLEWLERVGQRLDPILHQIAPNEPVLRAVYLSNWVPKTGNLSFYNKNLEIIHFTGQEPRPSLEILEQTFWKQLSLLEETERRAGSTLVGPHRDDWTFFLGDQVLKGHGSQGEVRSALLALKLSEIELFRKRTGHRPLLLLDDFSSELDQDRRTFLLRFLKETDLQVFVTTTEDSLRFGKRFRVLNGKVNDDTTNQHDGERVLSG